MLEATFIENFKVLIAAVLIYAIIFSMLKAMKLFGEDAKVPSLIALISAIIVSFTGVVTYIVSYAINWFVIIMFIIFLIFVLMLFVGIKMDDIASMASGNKKILLGVFALLFIIIFLKGFFAVNNTFDTTNPQENPYDVNTEYNTGVNDLASDETDGFLSSLSIDDDLLSTALFLGTLGLFVFLLG